MQAPTRAFLITGSENSIYPVVGLTHHLLFLFGLRLGSTTLENNKQRGLIVLNRPGTQQHRPESSMVTPPASG